MLNISKTCSKSHLFRSMSNHFNLYVLSHPSQLKFYPMLAIRQQVLAFFGLEPKCWPLQRDLKNDTLRSSSEPWHVLRGRQVFSSSSTCGYADGDPNRPRKASPGYDCRVDTINALWGFCRTNVISPRGCSLAAKCVDLYECDDGCGIPKSSGLPTITWYGILFFFLFLVACLPGLNPSFLYVSFVSLSKKKNGFLNEGDELTHPS